MPGDKKVSDGLKQFDGFEAPNHFFKVLFQDKVEANLGNVLPLDLNEDIPAPMVTYSEALQNSSYDLIMVNYEMLNEKEDKNKTWLIWHATSIPGSKLKKGYNQNSSVIKGKKLSSGKSGHL